MACEAVRKPAKPRWASEAASARRPGSIASVRRSIRWCRADVATRTPAARTAPAGYRSQARAKLENGRAVIAATSRARTVRRTVEGSILPAATGETPARRPGHPRPPPTPPPAPSRTPWDRGARGARRSCRKRHRWPRRPVTGQLTVEVMGMRTDDLDVRERPLGKGAHRVDELVRSGSRLQVPLAALPFDQHLDRSA